MSEAAKKKDITKRLIDTLFDKASLITIFVKIVRLIISVTTLVSVHTMFRQWYLDNDALTEREIPPMIKFVAFYFAIDFAINIIVTLIMVLFVSEDITRASLVDYIIGCLISLKLSMSASSILSRSGNFDYQSDGIILIDALKKFILGYVVLNTFIPYYLLVRHIIY